MARTSETGYGSGGSRPEAQTAALITAGYRLPAVPATVIENGLQVVTSGVDDKQWDESAPAYASIIEVALADGVIAPETVIAAQDATNPARALLDLHARCAKVLADRLDQRIETWLARYGLEPIPRRQYTLQTETYRQTRLRGGDGEPVHVLSVEHIEGMYYSFVNVPPRLRRAFEVVAKRLMMAGARRSDTDDHLERTLMGEAVDEAMAIADECHDDVDKAINQIKEERRYDRGGMVQEYIETYLDPGEREDEDDLDAQLREFMGLVAERKAATVSLNAAVADAKAPARAERRMRDLIDRIRREGASEYEQRWLRWFEAALAALRWHRLQGVDSLNSELAFGELVDSQPLDYTAMLDFGRSWCDDVVESMGAFIYEGGEPCIAFFPCGTRREAENAFKAITHSLLLDALLQAAICLDDV